MNALKKLKKAISLILRPENVVFRVIDIFSDKSDKQIKVRYQAIGKRLHTVESIQTLVQSLIHIRGFSDNDSKSILKTYQTEFDSPFSLSNIVFNENEIYLKILDKNSNEYFFLSIDSIKNDVELLKNFNEIDTKALIQLIFHSLRSKETEKMSTLLEGGSDNLIYLKHKT